MQVGKTVQPAEERTDRYLSRSEAAARLGVSRQRVEKLLKRWPQVTTPAGIDIHELRALRSSSIRAMPRPGYVSRGAAGRVLQSTRQRVQKLLKRFPEATAADGSVDLAKLRQLRGPSVILLRGLVLEAAAAHAGLSSAEFLSKVEVGALPRPHAVRVWDPRELDAAMAPQSITRDDA